MWDKIIFSTLRTLKVIKATSLLDKAVLIVVSLTSRLMTSEKDFKIDDVGEVVKRSKDMTYSKSMQNKQQSTGETVKQKMYTTCRVGQKEEKETRKG